MNKRGSIVTHVSHQPPTPRQSPRQRQDALRRAGLQCQTSIQVQQWRCSCIKAWEERKRNFWCLYLVNQRKTLPLRAWPEEGSSYISCPVCSNNAEHFIDHPGRLFTYLSFPRSIWRIVVLSLKGSVWRTLSTLQTEHQIPYVVSIKRIWSH